MSIITQNSSEYDIKIIPQNLSTNTQVIVSKVLENVDLKWNFNADIEKGVMMIPKGMDKLFNLQTMTHYKRVLTLNPLTINIDSMTQSEIDVYQKDSQKDSEKDSQKDSENEENLENNKS